jgi:chromosome segregation ATPase
LGEKLESEGQEKDLIIWGSNEDILELEERIYEYEQQIIVLRKETQKKDSEIEEKEFTVGISHSRLAEIQPKVETAEKNLANSEKSQKSLRDQISDLCMQNQELKVELNNKNKKIEELDDILSTEKAGYTTLDVTRTYLEDSLDHISKEIADKYLKNKEQSQEIGVLTVAKKGIKNDIQTLRFELNTLKKDSDKRVK